MVITRKLCEQAKEKPPPDWVLHALFDHYASASSSMRSGSISFEKFVEMHAETKVELERGGRKRGVGKGAEAELIHGVLGQKEVAILKWAFEMDSGERDAIEKVGSRA